ncbi:MAG: hypothetical protein MJZ37_07035 [Bacilli bacterium]|nr:hypothetical protein [Bacilli bacterium]
MSRRYECVDDCEFQEWLEYNELVDGNLPAMNFSTGFPYTIQEIITLARPRFKSPTAIFRAMQRTEVDWYYTKKFKLQYRAREIQKILAEYREKHGVQHISSRKLLPEIRELISNPK